MKKIGLVAAVVFFVLFILWGAALGNDQESDQTAELIQMAIKEGMELCDLLEKGNIVTMRRLDSISFSEGSSEYSEIEELKALIRKTKRLIEESRKLLQGISKKDEKAMNKEVAIEQLCRFQTNVEWVGAVQKTVFTILRMIFYPLLEKQNEITT